MGRVMNMMKFRTEKLSAPEELAGWRMEQLFQLFSKGFFADAEHFINRYCPEISGIEASKLTGKSLILDMLQQDLMQNVLQVEQGIAKKNVILKELRNEL